MGIKLWEGGFRSHRAAQLAGKQSLFPREADIRGDNPGGQAVVVNRTTGTPR